METITSNRYKCSKCHEELPEESFYLRSDRLPGANVHSWCKECHSIYSKEFYQNHKEHVANRMKRFKQALKYEAMNYYGRVCACCDEADFWFLEVDHIENDGASHRKEMGDHKWGGVNILRWLKANNWPEGFQFLCSNCNLAKARYKICPHQRRRVSQYQLADLAFPPNFQSNNAGGGS